jgi:hypothetical protein
MDFESGILNTILGLVFIFMGFFYLYRNRKNPEKKYSKTIISLSFLFGIYVILSSGIIGIILTF